MCRGGGKRWRRRAESTGHGVTGFIGGLTVPFPPTRITVLGESFFSGGRGVVTLRACAMSEPGQELNPQSGPVLVRLDESGHARKPSCLTKEWNGKHRKWQRRKPKRSAKLRTIPTRKRSGSTTRPWGSLLLKQTGTRARRVTHTIPTSIRRFSGPEKQSELRSKSLRFLSTFMSGLTHARSLKPCAIRTGRILSKDRCLACLRKTRRLGKQSISTNISTTGRTA